MKTNYFCIYGAGIVATSIYKVIKTIYQKQPLFFLVSDATEGKKDENPVEIDGIPVIRLSVWQRKIMINRDVSNAVLEQNGVKTKNPDKYLVAVPEVHHSTIMQSLSLMGVEREDIILITSEIENRIMEQYCSTLYPGGTVQTLISETRGYANMQPKEAMVQVFQAKCHVDKPLKNAVEISEYVVPIQVGSVFADRKIAEFQDNAGENISEKNRNYCELTAIYYAWKNSKAAYKGLCHYRRVFDISEKQMQSLLEREQKWDVILPYPSVHYPDISTQHLRYINESDWQAMLQALQEIAPEYLEAYEMAVALGEQHFFNYNMLIAKASIFDDYCEFLFSVLAKAEELTTPKGWERSDRFAGYMGENLTTIYFLKNRDRLKIRYAGKLWIT